VLLDDWSEVDPEAVYAWVLRQQQATAAEVARLEAEEWQRQQEEQQREVGDAVTSFYRRHPEAREADALLTAVAAVVGADGAAAMPDRIGETLEQTYAATKATTRAADRAHAENDFRSEFRRQAAISSGVFGSAARKHLQEGELRPELWPESRPPAVTEDDIARRLPAHLRGAPTQMQREAAVVKEAFNEHFEREKMHRADRERSQSLRRAAEAQSG
jgi:hypothetical protein